MAIWCKLGIRESSMKTRYFLERTVKEEVTKKEWVRAERAAGFHNTMGKPDEPGTGGFSNGNIRGIIEIDKNSNRNNL